MELYKKFKSVMMPKNHKIADACHVMKQYGISEVETKTALKKLLKLYENNWEFIIDDNYRVLLEVMLDKKPEKERVECKEKEALISELKVMKSENIEVPSYDKTEVVELPTKRLWTRQQKKQAMSSSKSCLKTTLSRAAHQNDDNQFSDSDEPKESQPLLRKAFLRHKEEEALIHESKVVKSKNKEALSNVKTVVELRTKRVYTTQRKQQVLSFSKSCLETTASRRAHQSDDNMFSDSEEPEESQPLLRRTFQRHQEEEVLVSGDNLRPAHKCNPRLEQRFILISEDSSSDCDGCNVHEDSLEIMEAEPLNVDSKNSVSDLPQIDVASIPPKGELKISLICNSSSQSDFYLPNLEVVEERCIKSYGNSECFLAMGTDSTVDENTRFRDVPDVLTKKDDYQGSNCSALNFTNESFVFRNLIKIVPHIPKDIASCGFKGLHHLIGFTVKDIENICGESRKRLKVLQGLQSSKLCKVEAAENHHSSLGVVNSCVYIDDISRGKEKVKISLEDGRNAEDLPTFFYIQRNLVYKNANVKFELARISDEGCCSDCYGDCLASPIPCACAFETGGEFAYAPGGLVKEKFLEECIFLNREPKAHHYFYCKKCPLEGSKKKSSVACKGHLLRKFIKECWAKCGCNKNCGNRTVQQGVTVKLQVFLTPDGKGWGLRTLDDLPRGAFVCEYVGEIVTNTELYERNKCSTDKKHTYPMLLDADWGSEGVLKDEEALCLDATVYGNVARFINHRCFDATLVEIPVEVETPDHHYYHVAFFTTRKVAAMEELTWDYGIDFDDHNHPVKAFHCVCGSPFCRDRNPRNH